MNLSKEFYQNLEVVIKRLDKEHGNIFKKIDWNKEADRCYQSMVDFFKRLNFEQFENDPVGVVDIRWNEYGGDIEIDFTPDNNLETAFDDGCIMNNSAVDNDEFFIEYFDCLGEDSFEKIDGDYFSLIGIFYEIFSEIVNPFVEDSNFQDLPKKDPYYITFNFSHDDEDPGVIFTTKEVVKETEFEKFERLKKEILESFKLYSDSYFNEKLLPISEILFLGMVDTNFNFKSMGDSTNGDEIFNSCGDIDLASFFPPNSGESIDEGFIEASSVLLKALKESAKSDIFKNIPKSGPIKFEFYLYEHKKITLCSINPDGTVELPSK